MYTYSLPLLLYFGALHPEKEANSLTFDWWHLFQGEEWYRNPYHLHKFFHQEAYLVHDKASVFCQIQECLADFLYEYSWGEIIRHLWGLPNWSCNGTYLTICSVCHRTSDYFSLNCLPWPLTLRRVFLSFWTTTLLKLIMGWAKDIFKIGKIFWLKERKWKRKIFQLF